MLLEVGILPEVKLQAYFTKLPYIVHNGNTLCLSVWQLGSFNAGSATKGVMNVISFLVINDSNLEKISSFIHSDCSWFLSVCLSIRTNFSSSVRSSCLIILSHLCKSGIYHHVYKVQPLILTSTRRIRFTISHPILALHLNVISHLRRSLLP